MYIELKDIRTFDEGGGTKFTLPSNIIRVIEFENVAVFFLDENGKRDKIVGVKFQYSQIGVCPNHYYVAWEFQVRDKDGNVVPYPFTSMRKRIHKEQELVYCSHWLDVGYFLNPDTGEIVDRIAIR
jgi:hypothetical protein